jgi:hypothetical protein
LRFSLAQERAAIVGLLRLTWLVAATFVLRRLRGRALLMAAVVRPILSVTTTTTVAAPTAMHAEAVLVAVALVAIALVAITLVAIALVVTVLPGVLLRLTAAGYECRQATDILPAFMSPLIRMIRLRLMLLAIVDLLVARWKWLSIAREIWLLLRFARRVARFILAHESLAIVIVAVETLVVPLLVLPAGCALLRLLIVVGVLLAELFLRGGNKTEIMLGVLVVILGGNRIAGALGVTRKLDIFFCNVRSRAANFNVRAV